MSINESHLPIVSKNPHYEDHKPPFILNRWLCSRAFLAVHVALCILLIVWTSHVSSLPNAQAGTYVYGLYSYHLFRLAFVLYALANVVVAYICGLKGLMSCKAMVRAFLLCVIFTVIWAWTVLFAPPVSEDRSLFSLQRMSYLIDGRLYVIHAGDTGSGYVFYTLYDCDRLEIICVKISRDASGNMFYGPPTLNIDRQRHIIQIIFDDAVEKEFPLLIPISDER